MWKALRQQRYRKRMVRVIGKFFFSFLNVYTTLLLEPGSRYIERRRNPDPFALYDICVALPRIIFCFHNAVTNRTVLLISRLIFLSLVHWLTVLFISFSRIHSMNYWHTVITFICLYIAHAGEHSGLQAALVHAGYIYYLDFDYFFFWLTHCIYQFCYD